MTVQDITPIDDHAIIAISRLTQIYKDPVKQYSVGWSADLKSGWEVLIHALTIPSQSLEDIMGDMLQGRGLSSSTGVNLDRIGQIVGADRGSNGDSNYIVIITAKIAENNSDGTAANLLNILRILQGPRFISSSIKELFPAKVVVDYVVTEEVSLQFTTNNNQFTIYDVGIVDPQVISVPVGLYYAGEVASIIETAFLDSYGEVVSVTYNLDDSTFTINLDGTGLGIEFGSSATLLGFESFGFDSDADVGDTLGFGYLVPPNSGGGIFATLDNGNTYIATITGDTIGGELILGIDEIQSALEGAKVAGVDLRVEVVVDGNYLAFNDSGTDDTGSFGYGSIDGGETIGGGHYTSLNI